MTAKQRSAQMSKVRAKGNRSTEMRVAARLIRNGVRGWQRHPAGVLGCPDFHFRLKRVVIFVDGCFWHGCSRCARRMPHSRREFWEQKIGANRLRDRKVTRRLKMQGFTVLRIWEHQLNDSRWLTRLRSILGA